eukprot:TRINITY_DN15982_c0_g1_i1.p1 TRINITY_DN15982_c0_g1~~TRINITY_DN15982_c0_g1_i1.p1  ORF type:complete len:270 (+),score=19.33 TRINITY_DN15982_c0_g1_i1:67-876(+)
MDFVVNQVADSVSWLIHSPPDSITVRFLANYIVLLLGGAFFYLFFASLSFYFFFVWGRKTFYPSTLPSDLSKQIKVEITNASSSLPIMALLMTPFPLLLQYGYGRIYYSVDDYGWAYLILSVALFIIVTDFSIYWVHRGLHHPIMYKNIHKLHHTYRYTTPFSSHAFHPIDGWAQGVSYYLFCFIFPLHHILFVVLFMFVNIWTISIHDQVDFSGAGLLNSTGHHTIHHVEFSYNYGQYFTIWDRVFLTYKPSTKTHSYSDLAMKQHQK